MTGPVLLATRNQHKLTELRRILAPLIAVEVIGLGDVEPFDEVPETGATFAANALIKAHDAFAHTGLVTVADDSGLCVDALNGMPGVLSARWAGAAKNDAANLRLVLEQLADVPDERLQAQFVCAVALLTPPPSSGAEPGDAGGAGRSDGAQRFDGSAREQVVHGRMPGRIVRRPRGQGGFGYDPIFVADGQSRTSAELDAAEKDAISHRGRALRELAPVLVGALTGAPTARP